MLSTSAATSSTSASAPPRWASPIPLRRRRTRRPSQWCSPGMAIAASGGYRRGFIANDDACHTSWTPYGHRRSASPVRPCSPPTATADALDRLQRWLRTSVALADSLCDVGCLLVERDSTVTTNLPGTRAVAAPRLFRGIHRCTTYVTTRCPAAATWSRGSPVSPLFHRALRLRATSSRVAAPKWDDRFELAVDLEIAPQEGFVITVPTSPCGWRIRRAGACARSAVGEHHRSPALHPRARRWFSGERDQEDAGGLTSSPPCRARRDCRASTP